MKDIYLNCLIKEEDVYWTGLSGRMILITIPTTPDDGETPRRRRRRRR